MDRRSFLTSSVALAALTTGAPAAFAQDRLTILGSVPSLGFPFFVHMLNQIKIEAEAQEVDLIDGMPVLYSLGNLVFGSTGRYTEEFPGYSLVARTYLGPDGPRATELTCIVTDNEIVNHQPRPCTAAQADTVLRSLGPHVAIRGDKGLVELRPAAAAPTDDARPDRPTT